VEELRLLFFGFLFLSFIITALCPYPSTLPFYQFATFITYVALNIIMSALKDKDTSSANYNCRLCGEHFDSFGDMQRHELVKHVQEGDIDNHLEK